MNKIVYAELKRVYWNTSQDRNVRFFFLHQAWKRLHILTFVRCSQQSHQCLKGRNWRNGFGGTTRGTKTPIFTKWNKLFRNACKDHRGHGGGRKERSVRYYFAAAWECYTYEYRSVPSSVALLSISLHLSRVLFTPCRLLIGWHISIAGSWSEAKCERLCVNREGQYIPTPSVFITKPHCGSTAVRKGYSHYNASQNFVLHKKKRIQHRSNKILPNNFFLNILISSPRQNTGQNCVARHRIGCHLHPEARLLFIFTW